MATLIENLTARKNAIGVELAAMSATTAGGKPDAGKSGIGHVAYKDGLYRELEWIEKAIEREGLNVTDGNATVFEITTFGEV